MKHVSTKPTVIVNANGFCNDVNVHSGILQIDAESGSTLVMNKKHLQTTQTEAQASIRWKYFSHRLIKNHRRTRPSDPLLIVAASVRIMGFEAVT
ncbi:hypothetical protein LTR66_008794 [Elasticomyces elasticus]|nr:hypothetical protein LTR66_008794 [Elasticomyces elasticus]